MTLRRKMAYQIAAMIIGLLVLSAASIWGIVGLHQDFGSAIAGHRELRQLYEAESHVYTAQRLILLSAQGAKAALEEIDQASVKFGKHAESGPIRAGLKEAQTQLRMLIAAHVSYSAAEQVAPLKRVQDEVGRLSVSTRRTIEQAQDHASHKREGTLIVMGIVSLLVIAGAIVVGVLEYRSVTRPLLSLGNGVRRLAEGKLSEPHRADRPCRVRRAGCGLQSHGERAR